MASILINDFVTNKRVKLFFLPDDFELVDEQWDREDRLLVHLQSMEFFKGRTRWGDLETPHFRLLIAKNLQHAATLTEEERMNDEHPVVSSLNFLICALMRSIEKRNDCHVELMRINRISDLDIAIEFTGALSMEVVSPPSSPQKKIDPFSVVVDNTKPNE